MEIQEHTPVYCAGESQYSLLRYAAMAAKWHEPARDALDKLTLGAGGRALLAVRAMPCDAMCDDACCLFQWT